MTIRVEIIADTAAQARQEMSNLLATGSLTPIPVERAVEPRSEVTEAGKAAIADYENTPAPRRRGRPRKEQSAPAEAQAENPMASASAPQAAVGENTASAPAVSSLAAEGASPDAAADDPSKASAAAAITLDTVRERLQALVARFGGKDGVLKAAEILGEFGYAKVKEVTAEHFQPIVERVEKALAA